ncbi:GntR family transcriptional regulator [Nocardia neocaledoniensis]|uniref:DNA-binding GntR family transcriptional regulator n=1 Tax=Nocardia neocaledoniensis TaxID=236511 RepID=A0A317NIR9_9NOCA|nr:GntR family transcriptional regulator [Nocardia neocaledoniensis]PWV75000.1 DNA-binding GntR family transcriptional regulator [Nocardia neocaledoniensis]
MAESGEDSSGEMIARTVRAEILSGRLPAGERLIAEVLAKRFGVSRIPVREALARLQSEGFVTIVRHRGATVAEPPVAAARELLQVRRGLEVLAAQLAGENRGGCAAAELAGFLSAASDEHSGSGQPFHELIARASGNEELIRLLAEVNARVRWALGHNPTVSVSDHRAVALAVLNGAPVQAGFLMEEHLRRDEVYFAQD